MSKYEVVKERIAKILKNIDKGCPKGKDIFTGCDSPHKDCFVCSAELILSDPDILIKSDLQELPESIVRYKGQLKRLLHQANFVKVERKD